MHPSQSEADGGLLEMLALDEVGLDCYRADLTFVDHPYALYGGQVAAQALQAAGQTVPRDRLPHSLHGYYLRPGDTSRPTLFKVVRDRDGRSYSARRVIAIQDDEVIFTMSLSFHAPEAGLQVQTVGMPDVPLPGSCEPYVFPRLFSMEGRRVTDEQPGTAPWPTMFWARATIALPRSPLCHASVLTYLSDMSSGLAALCTDQGSIGASLDHSVWFHRPVRLDRWVLIALAPGTVGHGRGWYTGHVFSESGCHVATLTQESLFRPGPLGARVIGAVRP